MPWLARRRFLARPHLRLIALVGLIVPRRLRSDWRREWEAELGHREALLADWDKLNWQTKFDLCRRSTSAFWDALRLQPRRLEEEVFQDLRYGARMLIKHQSLTSIAVLTLALGVGANTAIFSLVDAALLRPLPGAAAPDELVLFASAERGLSYPDFKVLQERNGVLAGLAVSAESAISFGNGARSEIVLGATVSGNYFDVLGIRPALGRTFLPEEDATPGTHPVVILSHSFWQSRFNSDPALIGQTIVLNNQRFTVVGVAPAGFGGPRLWAPAMMTATTVRLPWGAAPRDPLSDPQYEIFGAIGRLKPGVSIAQAQVALDAISRGIEQAKPAPPGQGPHQPNPNEARRLRLTRPWGALTGPLREWAMTPSKLLAATVFTVLLIACANVANLLMARAATRRKEVAVRLALGATRQRLIRQLLTESLLLALAGAAAGLLLACWIIQLLNAFKPPFPPPFDFPLAPALDVRTLGFSLLLALATSLIFGLVPALQASKPDVVPALKDEGGAEVTRLRRLNLRNAVVVVQVALSLTLLISTGLFLRSLSYARQIDLGFKPEHVLEATFTFSLHHQGYDEAGGREFYRQLVERLERLPGAKTACVTNVLPLGFMAPSAPVAPEGHEIPLNDRPRAGNFAVGPRYFETIGTPLLRGRDFAPQDTASSPPVAIVSEKLARRLWPEIKDPAEALGKRLRAGEPGSVACEVIGVARDSKNNIFNSIDHEPAPTLYRPFSQNYSSAASVIVRSSGDPSSLIPAVRREIAALDANLSPEVLHPLSETVGLALWSARTWAAVLSFFGLLGLALAGVGVYGVMSYAVARRTREIGVRMALGAQARDVMKLIVKQGMGLALLGIVLGLALALAVTRFLASQLYGVTATDPATFVGVALFLISAVMLACYLPARKATKVDPLVALRHD